MNLYLNYIRTWVKYWVLRNTQGRKRRERKSETTTINDSKTYINEYNQPTISNTLTHKAPTFNKCHKLKMATSKIYKPFSHPQLQPLPLFSPVPNMPPHPTPPPIPPPTPPANPCKPTHRQSACCPKTSASPNKYSLDDP